MRLSLRFIIPLIIALGLMAYAVVPLVDSLTFKWFLRDLESRALLIGNTAQESLAGMLERPGDGRIEKYFNRLTRDERLFAMGYCERHSHRLYASQGFPEDLNCASPEILGQSPHGRVIRLTKGPLHLAVYPLVHKGEILGQLVLIHDLSYIQRRSSDTKAYIVYLFAAMGLIISALTVVIAQLSWKGWLRGLKAVLRGEGFFKPYSPAVSPEFRPIVKDLRILFNELEQDRRDIDESRTRWSPTALREILRKDLTGDEVLIVSNREPYIHVRRNDKIEIQNPASGVVTALEPVMRACSGTWIAHGAGSADREVVDKNDHVKVPPQKPAYDIRRVWLTKEEERGYYYGFANEGIWALCHIAHVRPVFRPQDWAHYVAVNRKFADAVIQEAATADPVVLVQDYHFALLPKMIRERLPKATVISFWHIPFPNPEVFGICPWRDEIIDGLLGSSILGFHTRFHCTNFLDSVDRFVESRVDRETSSVTHKGNLTKVNHYPISIEFPVRWMEGQLPVSGCRDEIRRLYALDPDHKIGIGVDRLDYTKGIIERFLSVERLLELHPEWRGKFSFVQIAAPSRSTIEPYQRFAKDVETEAHRINARFGGSGAYQPIILKIEHHEPDQVYRHYRAADLCFVSSLHDGMNLVAKEYIAARDDERGVLILSQFTGASRELSEALIVNPYDLDQCALALHTALSMPAEEQRNRVRSMRAFIQEFNVYRWAGRMLLDAARLRRRLRLFGTIHSSVPHPPAPVL
jgi:trehalose-6-phosphate synthase